MVTVFLTERGLSVLELSVAFSVTFLFQFASASISGVIADKLGNVKPVLLFHMLATIIVIVSMILLPSTKVTPPLQSSINVTCVESIINSNHPGINSNSQNGSMTFFMSDEIIFNVTTFLDCVNVQCFRSVEEDKLVAEFEKENCSTNLTDIFSKTICTDIKLCYDPNVSRNSIVALYLVLTVLFFAFWSTSFRCMDVIAVSLSVEHDSFYGKERVLTASGELVTSLIAAFVFNVTANKEVKNKYDSMLWVSSSIMAVSAISVCNITAVILPSGQHLGRKALKLLKNLDVVIFIAVVFIAGCGYCFYLNFYLWFLESLEAPNLVISLHTMAFSFYGIPILCTSKWWLKHLGTTKVIALGLLFYTINGTLNSFLYNPWLFLLTDSTIVFTYHLFMVAAVIHAYNIAPEGFGATVISVIGAVHYGTGKFNLEMPLHL